MRAMAKAIHQRLLQASEQIDRRPDPPVGELIVRVQDARIHHVHVHALARVAGPVVCLVQWQVGLVDAVQEPEARVCGRLLEPDAEDAQLGLNLRDGAAKGLAQGVQVLLARRVEGRAGPTQAHRAGGPAPDPPAPPTEAAPLLGLRAQLLCHAAAHVSKNTASPRPEACAQASARRQRPPEAGGLTDGREVHAGLEDEHVRGGVGARAARGAPLEDGRQPPFRIDIVPAGSAPGALAPSSIIILRRLLRGEEEMW
eukprot:scaffold1259_cov368-Prasinococcus_capsulatus_cf.AAC.7